LVFRPRDFLNLLSKASPGEPSLTVMFFEPGFPMDVHCVQHPQSFFMAILPRGLFGRYDLVSFHFHGLSDFHFLRLLEDGHQPLIDLQDLRFHSTVDPLPLVMENFPGFSTFTLTRLLSLYEIFALKSLSGNRLAEAFITTPPLSSKFCTILVRLPKSLRRWHPVKISET